MSEKHRPGMAARALGLLSPKAETFIRRERKKAKRINKIMVVPRPLNKDEADQLARKLFGCNADEALKMIDENTL
jgi:hypothetical protein